MIWGHKKAVAQFLGAGQAFSLTNHDYLEGQRDIHLATPSHSSQALSIVTHAKVVTQGATLSPPLTTLIYASLSSTYMQLQNLPVGVSLVSITP